MSSVLGHVIFPFAVCAKPTIVHMPPANGPSRKCKFSSGFWGVKKITCGKTNVGNRLKWRNAKVVKCSFSLPFGGSGSMAGNFDENGEEYVNCSVIDAVELESSPVGFMIKLCNGQQLMCARNIPQAGKPANISPCPAIVLKTQDGTDLLLPIVVLEPQSAFLMVALKNVEIARPTIYEFVTEMIEEKGYAVKFVRIKTREDHAYFSQIYLTKLGDNTQYFAFDLRPSDSINIAVRCKAPIQVNKNLAFRDGMRVYEVVSLSDGPLPDVIVSTESDSLSLSEGTE